MHFEVEINGDHITMERWHGILLSVPGKVLKFLMLLPVSLYTDTQMA